MKAVSALCLSLFLFTFGAAPARAADVAVDSAGNSYFIVNRGFDGFFVAKVSPLGELIFERPLNLLSGVPLDIAVDSAGFIYIAGTANFDIFSGHEADQAFVAKLTPDGTGAVYQTFLGSNTRGVDLAVDAQGQAYLLHQFTNPFGPFPGVVFQAVVRFSPEGSTHSLVGGRTHDVTAIALGPSGDLFTVGWAPPIPDDDENPYWWVILERVDASSGVAVTETLIEAGGTLDWFVDVAATPGDGAVVAGTKSGGLLVAEFSPAGETIFSRVLNVGAVSVQDVAVTSSGEIVVTYSTGSGNHVLRLEGGTGKVLFSSLNLPPDCSGATASPSVLWPANGKMVPISILGVTEPQGDAVTVRVTGITQDEPGAAFSGIGSPTAQVKAERDGKGDGRAYRIQFEATDPSGASCTGEVTVCVPHDRGKGSCVDGNR